MPTSEAVQSKPSHTDGPWELIEPSEARQGDDRLCWLVRSPSHRVATVHSRLGKSADQYSADARLIAAAPELLDACHDAKSVIDELLEDLTDDPKEDVAAQRVLKTLRDVIAKATGMDATPVATHDTGNPIA